MESVELEGTTLEEVLVDLATDKDITPLRLLKDAPREVAETTNAVRQLVRGVVDSLVVLPNALRLGLLLYFAQGGGTREKARRGGCEGRGGGAGGSA